MLFPLNLSASTLLEPQSRPQSVIAWNFSGPWIELIFSVWSMSKWMVVHVSFEAQRETGSVYLELDHLHLLLYLKKISNSIFNFDPPTQMENYSNFHCWLVVVLWIWTYGITVWNCHWSRINQNPGQMNWCVGEQKAVNGITWHLFWKMVTNRS